MKTTVCSLVLVFAMCVWSGCGRPPGSDLSSDSEAPSSTSTESLSESSQDTGTESSTATLLDEETASNSETQTETITETDTWSALCDHIPVLPVEPKSLHGFADAEDFAFDDRGNAVMVDAMGNLVRITKNGVSETWVPELIMGGAAGTAFLPSGDLVVSNSVDTIYKVFENGGSVALTSGLAYPNGVTVGLDGMVYVAETSGGRIREVDPETGEFSIIASGLNNPNGLAFSPDYQTLYCGSFGSGIIYKVSRDGKGGWGVAEEFARTPGAPGDPAKDACRGKEEGDPCEFGMSGICESSTNGLVCTVVSVCDGKTEGDSCEEWGMSGKCQDDGFGGLYCVPIDPCEGKVVGDTCLQAGMEGECFDWGDGYLFCRLPDPCEDKSAGEPCTTEWGTQGECVDDGMEGLFCREINPCDGKLPGDACVTLSGIEGVCVEYDWGAVFCEEPDPCEGKTAGEACIIGGMEGTCVDGGFGWLYCNVGDGGGGGGLDGIGVDACGYVYVTEYVVGKVWRFAPTGGVAELVFDTDVTGWIPNMDFGSGYGGWELNNLYVAERGSGLMFEVPLGILGAPKAFPPPP